jgi:hypothetical protein
MKPAQWIGAVLAGAAMVFVITFALNYIGSPSGPGNTGKPKSEPLQLTFPVVQAPPGEPIALLPTEINKPDWYDFWFRNENDQPVQVGLEGKNCKCSNVRLYLLPSDFQGLLSADWDAAFGLALGAGPAVAAKGPLAAGRLAEELQPVALDQLAKALVPPGGRGWVRVGWSGERPGPQRIKATLWTDNKAEGPTVDLNAAVMYHAPAQATTNVSAGTLNVRLLEKAGSSTVNILCWSATRPAFRLTAQPDTVRGGNASSDPFEVGTPVPLTAAERAGLEKRESELPGSVRCGWRVPVTLRAVSADGKTPFELGLFHRWVRLTSPDEGIEPMQVMVTGRVVGDVTVSGDEEGRVIFGNFKRRNGTSWHGVALESDTPETELKLEEQRVPKYLEVKFHQPTGKAREHRTWRLEVRVRPNEARGQFPRQEDPAYADSAVYVQMAGKTPRSIRIAVSGTAND